MNDPVLGVPFDSYERYRVTAEIVRQLVGGSGGALRLLDVGGHNGSLKHFLPDHRVLVADIKEPPRFVYRESVPTRWDAFVRSAGGSLPFRDASFDVVTAQDTLEHVPETAREGFLRDLVRVARRFVVINGPVETGSVAEAERRLADYWDRVQDWERHPLQEHLDLGLPARDWVERTLKGLGATWTAIPNGNLNVWLSMMALKYYVDGLPDGQGLHEALDRAFNRFLAPQDLDEPTYRIAYVLATRDEAASLDGLPAAVTTALRASAPPAHEGLDAIEPLVAAFEEHGVHLRSTLRWYHETATELQTLLNEASERLRLAESELQDKKAILVGKAEQIKEKDTAILQRDWIVRAQEKRLAALESSPGLRLGRRLRHLVNQLAPYGTYRRAALRLLRGGPFRPPLRRPQVVSGIVLHPGRAPDAYELWLYRNELDDDRISRMRDEARRFAYRPKISVLVPTYNTEPDWLADAIDSVRAQIYDNWELCIADDGSTRRDTRTTLRRYSRGEPRIKVTFAKRNSGIVSASNAALAMATGEFVALLDHDDVLQPEAVFEVVKALNERSDADFIYTDEDKIELDGRRAEPFFKPDWSPDLLGSLNYVTHLSVFRKELAEGLGGFRRGFDGSQDYDLILRVTEAADSIIHVPRPVYSWRKAPGSAAASSEAKPYAYEAAKRALQESLERRGYEGEVLDGPFTGHYRIRYRLRERPRVSIVVPTRDRLDLVTPCVESIRERTSYDNYELVIVDNDSHEPETLEYLDRFDGRVIHHPGPFNFARIMNHTVEEIDTPMVLFLNNDTEVIEGEWLEAMLEHGQRPDVAAVGARLLFPDGTPQHEGILVGLGGGLAGNIVAERYGFGVAIRNVSAVTAACMLTRAEVFRELGGFDEGLAVAYNDVDFCLRAREKGYLIVYTPHALLYHKEGGSRGLDGGQPPEDRTRFRSRWSSYRDPYYNPNFDLERPFKLELEW